MKSNNRNLTRLTATFAIVCAALLAGCYDGAAASRVEDAKSQKFIEQFEGKTIRALATSGTYTTFVFTDGTRLTVKCYKYRPSFH